MQTVAANDFVICWLISMGRIVRVCYYVDVLAIHKCVYSYNMHGEGSWPTGGPCLDVFIIRTAAVLLN